MKDREKVYSIVYQEGDAPQLVGTSKFPTLTEAYINKLSAKNGRETKAGDVFEAILNTLREAGVEDGHMEKALKVGQHIAKQLERFSQATYHSNQV